MSHGASLLTRDSLGLTAMDLAEKGDHKECMQVNKRLLFKITLLCHIIFVGHSNTMLADKKSRQTLFPPCVFPLDLLFNPC